MKNTEVHLVSYPDGLPTLEHFAVVETELPELKEREILIKNSYVSVDPYMSGRMEEGCESYVEPFGLDEPLEGDAVGEIVASNHPDYQVGEAVAHMLGWRKYAVLNPDEWVSEGPEAVDQFSVLRKVDTDLAPASCYIGALGMPGITAYGGLVYAGEVKSSDTVFVSGAAGAVGSLVGQIAKGRGCTVIGSAGSDEKVRYLTDTLGFDHAYNYKVTTPSEALREFAPEGIDLYFDNVGGEHLEAALAAIRPWGRVVECGYISGYGAPVPPGPKNYWPALFLNITIRGLLAPAYFDKYHELYEEVGNRIKSGEIKFPETILNGIEKTPEAFTGLFTGANLGKMLVKV